MDEFEKYIPKNRHLDLDPIFQLELKEALFVPEMYNKRLYQRVYSYKRRYGKVFKCFGIKNGTIILRIR